MMNKLFTGFFLFGFIMFFSACSDKRESEDLFVYKTLLNTLNSANLNINSINRSLYYSIENKLQDRSIRQTAEVWWPKAQLLQKLVADIDTYIDSLKNQLRKESGLQIKYIEGRMVEDYQIDNVEVPRDLFETKGKGKELEQRLLDFKANVLAIDPKIKKEFEYTLPIDMTPFSKEKTFTQVFFHGTQTIKALTVLSKFQNNIKVAENQVIMLCHNEATPLVLIHEYPQAIVNLSSSYVKQGQEIVVSAGIGNFFVNAQPQIFVNGKSGEFNGGMAYYKVSTLGKAAGKYTLPITFRYWDEQGQEMILKKEIEYEVAPEPTPCN